MAITYRCFLVTEPGAKPVPWDELSPEQIKAAKAAMQKRLSAVMSDYYTQHPEEYIKIGGKEC